VALTAAAKETEPSLGIQLLTDLGGIFGEQEHVSTRMILAELCASIDTPQVDRPRRSPVGRHARHDEDQVWVANFWGRGVVLMAGAEPRMLGHCHFQARPLATD
jgi:hypothetical protein